MILNSAAGELPEERNDHLDFLPFSHRCALLFHGHSPWDASLSVQTILATWVCGVRTGVNSDSFREDGLKPLVVSETPSTGFRVRNLRPQRRHFVSALIARLSRLSSCAHSGEHVTPPRRALAGSISLLHNMQNIKFSESAKRT
jgi:hypothetical protein